MNRHKLFLISAVICLMLLVCGMAGAADPRCKPCNPVNSGECGFTQGSVKVTIDGFEYSYPVICVGKTVSFKIKGYSDVDWCDDPEPIADEPIQYRWELDGGNQSSGDSWSYTFDDPGEYVVGWFVKDPGNKADDIPNPCEDSEEGEWDYCGEIAVIAVGVASLTGPKELCKSESGRFTATTDPSGYEDMLTWTYTNDDGESVQGGTGGTFSMAWWEEGARLVTVSCGESSSKSKVVQITEWPPKCEGMSCGGDGGGGFDGDGPGGPGGGDGYEIGRAHV